MSKTWNQLQWRRNNENDDLTISYEVFRSLTSPLDENNDLIMTVDHPADGEFVLVSDTNANKGGNDDHKHYIGPTPYDMASPLAPTNLTITPDIPNNRGIVTWDHSGDDIGTTYYYRVRAKDSLGDYSDLSFEQSGTLISDLHATPYILEFSDDGVNNWTPLPNQLDKIYYENNVDISGPNTVTNFDYTTEQIEDGVGKVTLTWTNPDADNGNYTKYYRVKCIDDTANKFPGHTNNESLYSSIANAVIILVGITDTEAGVEIVQRESTADGAVPISITFDVDDKYMGYTEIALGTVLVKSDDETITYVEGTDYSITYFSGTIHRIDGASIVPGQTIKITELKYNDGIEASDSDTILGVADGTYFTEGYSGDCSIEHSPLPDSSTFNYRIRVKDDAGNWSPIQYLHASVPDYTAPATPENFTLTTT